MIATVRCFSILLMSAEFASAAGAAPQGWPEQVRVVEYPTSIDGSRQPTLFYRADGDDNRPLLVGLHTWSSGYDQAGGEVVYARWCIEHNWNFIHPHFRGPNWTPEACGSELAVQDILDAVKYAKQTCHVDANRIYLVGVSGGGYAALLMAGRAPDMWAGVSAWAPISDLQAWWAQQRNGNHSNYAMHVERAVGGRPDRAAQAAEECVKRSPITYLNKAAGVNLDINAGVADGHSGGSVPFTHSLIAFNHLAALEDRLDSEFIEGFYNQQRLPPGTPTAKLDPLYGKKYVVFRKISGNTRVTVFNGGHEIIHQAALNWLANQRKDQPANRHPTMSHDLKVNESDSKAGK